MVTTTDSTPATAGTVRGHGRPARPTRPRHHQERAAVRLTLEHAYALGAALLVAYGIVYRGRR